MMELVDMQGLKPCPKRGPGSSPGVGTYPKFVSIIYIYYVRFKYFKRLKFLIFFCVNVYHFIYVFINISSSCIFFFL